MQLEGLINKRALRKEIRLACLFICPNAFQIQNKDIEDILKKEDIDWEFFYKIAYCQCVSEIVYTNVSDFHSKSIPDHVLELFKKKYYRSILRNNRLREEFIGIAKELESNSIKFIPFKGIIFNNLIYPSGLVRNTQDIDIMIQREQFPEVKAVLTKFGYRTARDTDKLSINDNFMEFIRYERSKNFSYILDMQWGNEASFRDANKNGLSDLWQRVRNVQLNGLKISCLCPEDMLFNLFFHQRRFGMPFSLKTILDISYVVSRHQKEIDWAFVIKQARLNRVTSLVFFCLSVANELFGCHCPTAILRKINPGFIRKKLFSYFFARNLNYTGPGARQEITSPYFIFISALLYDRLIDLFIYANRLSFHQFVRFCGFKRHSLVPKILFILKFIYLPIFIFLRYLRTKR